jgi:hypothetical protein
MLGIASRHRFVLRCAADKTLCYQMDVLQQAQPLKDGNLPDVHADDVATLCGMDINSLPVANTERHGFCRDGSRHLATFNGSFQKGSFPKRTKTGSTVQCNSDRARSASKPKDAVRMSAYNSQYRPGSDPHIGLLEDRLRQLKFTVDFAVLKNCVPSKTVRELKKLSEQFEALLFAYEAGPPGLKLLLAQVRVARMSSCTSLNCMGRFVRSGWVRSGFAQPPPSMHDPCRRADRMPRALWTAPST